MSNKIYIDFKDFLKRYHFSIGKGRKLVRDKKVPFYRFGRSIRFLLSDLEEWEAKMKEN